MNSVFLCSAPESTKGMADWITAYSTTGLLVFTIILARIAYVTYKGNEKFNRLQSIKNTIFKLIDFHYKIVESISVRNIKAGITAPGVQNTVSGAKAFESMYEDFKKIYNNTDGNYFNNDEVQIIKTAFFDLYVNNWSVSVCCGWDCSTYD